MNECVYLSLKQNFCNEIQLDVAQSQLVGLVPVLRLGVPVRYKASKLWYPLKIPPLFKKRMLV